MVVFFDTFILLLRSLIAKAERPTDRRKQDSPVAKSATGSAQQDSLFCKGGRNGSSID